MRVKPLDLDELGLDIAPADHSREPGVHMSDLYGSLYQKLEPERFKKDTEPAPALLAIGLALEQYTERLLLNAGIGAFRPPQFQTPDEYKVWFSPDLLISNGVLKGGEIKATFMSSREWPEEDMWVSSLPPKADKYVTQMKSYGHNLEVNEWWLLVWFLKGKWEKGRAEDDVLAKFRPYHLVFTAQEMADEYRTLINHGKHEGLL